MRVKFRSIFDKAFTILTGLSAVLLTIVIVVILGPMIWRGLGAVVFKGTIEFRKMQLALYGRGNESDLKVETAEVESSRRFIYEIIDKFKQDIDTEVLKDRARQIYRQFGRELRYNNISGEQYRQLRSLTRDIRDKFEDAFVSNDRAKIRKNLEYILQYEEDERLKNTVAADFFSLAAEFQKAIEKVDLEKRQHYAKSLEEVEEIISHLFGPRPEQPLPALMMHRYGATRWDQAQALLDELLWAEQWVEQEPGKPLVKVKVRREGQFADTELEHLFGFVENNLHKMLKPRWTFYWQYFLDDNTPGHYFGGVGPEILGTLLLTFLSMLFAVPLGVISAACLVECASDNFAVRIIRMCINTLAGVPSIVFGLFGLAFFVLYFLPLFGAPSKPCILAGSMTLAILTLPVMIRASEEAIRSVPQTYKEASLALGASKFRTFVTVTLPVALPGILTGIILSLSRVAGETAPILFTAAVALGPIPKSVFDATRTLSYGSYDMAVGDRLAMMVPHKQYGMVMTLVMLILCLNALAIILRSRIFRKLKGH